MINQAQRTRKSLRGWLTLGIVLCGLLRTGVARAQETAPSAPPAGNPPAAPAGSPATPGTPATANPAPGLITSPTYRILVDDVLQVTVTPLNGVGQVHTNETLAVLSDGTADVPFLGETKVVGLTLSELKGRIKKVAAKYFEDPRISIAVRARFQKTVNVNSTVLPNRGKIILGENWKVRDVISAAGSLPTDRYDLLEASLYRNATGEVITLDLQRLLGDLDPAQNLPVEAGDFLTVKEIDPTRTQIQVIGQVQKPGPVVIPRNRSLVEVLQAAGGPTERAALSEVRIEREGKDLIVNMTDYRKTGFEPAEKLKMGDRVIVPENRKEILLQGAFGRGGIMPYPDDQTLTLTQVIARAGGQVQGAELKSTRITRFGPDGKQKSTMVVNVEKILKTGDYSDDPVIQPGDQIYVPPAGRRKGFNLQEMVGIVSGVVFLLYQASRI
ncbi:MAG: polysaccharide biosynthesis/export family protein [Capsulimonadales bacterium]|nr:polysaccharide biosynthesis/export family protein [Capsulimonadales bacterium]